ncbi:MAG: FtsX-like permease family protein [Anaerolineales bacterium]
MHIPARWMKVLKEMWENKSRSILVVLSLAIGVATVGMINTAAIYIQRDLFGAFDDGSPASLHMYISPFRNDVAQAVENMREVETTQPRRVKSASFLNADGTWEDITLNAFPDLEDVAINVPTLEEGRMSLSVREVVIERQSAEALGLAVGDMLLIKNDVDREFELEVVGIVHDLYVMPYELLGEATAFVTMGTMGWMGDPSTYNRLDIIVSDMKTDRDHVLDVGERVKEQVLQPAGYFTYRTEIPGIGSDPGRHWAEDQINGLLLIFQIMGIMAILLSSGLVVNTISAIIVQQVKQIGIMRSIGAVRRQIVGMYLFNVFIFTVLGLLLAIPLGLIGAAWLANFAAAFANFDIRAVDIPLQVLALQVVLGLLLPLGVAMFPVLSGTKISVYDAIYQYGISGEGTRGLVDRLLMRVRHLTPPVLLALRNTFRNKARLAFTLVTLTLAGAMFIGVFSTRASLSAQIDEVARYLNFDAAMTVPRGSMRNTVEREAHRIPGVEVVESWSLDTATIQYGGDRESEELEIVGLPADAQTIDPMLVAGRWITVGETHGVVVNEDLTGVESDIEVGSEITLKVGTKEQTYEVVGIASKHLSGPRVYMTPTMFGGLTNRYNQADFVRTRLDAEKLSSPAAQDALGAQLEARFENAGITNSSSITHHTIFGDFTDVFDMILIILIVMAVLLAIVGGLGLTGTLSINVMERTREIGVMRAVGASNQSVRRVILIEGVVVGFVSWVLGAVLSGPTGRALAAAVVDAIMNADLSYQYSFPGLLIWLLVVALIGVFASLAPAQRAASLTVREVLDYE